MTVVVAVNLVGGRLVDELLVGRLLDARCMVFDADCADSGSDLLAPIKNKLSARYKPLARASLNFSRVMGMVQRILSIL